MWPAYKWKLETPVLYCYRYLTQVLSLSDSGICFSSYALYMLLSNLEMDSILIVTISLATEIAKVECEGIFLAKTKCQSKAITLGLIQRLTKNGRPRLYTEGGEGKGEYWTF
ncbi:hypothetical protein M8J77_021782 [Diaphorina citri]|nr:hypothetical protein M8J77_021782 [Diaphorina citri]